MKKGIDSALDAIVLQNTIHEAIEHTLNRKDMGEELKDKKILQYIKSYDKISKAWNFLSYDYNPEVEAESVNIRNVSRKVEKYRKELTIENIFRIDIAEWYNNAVKRAVKELQEEEA